MRSVQNLGALQHYAALCFQGYRAWFSQCAIDYHNRGRPIGDIERDIAIRVIQIQANWSNITRSVVTSSAIGAVDVNGKSHRSTARRFKTQAEVLTWVMKKLGTGGPVFDPQSRLTSVREPAWYNRRTIVNAAKALQLTNLPAVVKATSGKSQIVEHFTTLRNYYAHRGPYLRLVAREIAHAYSNPAPLRPVDTVFQVDPATRLPLWNAWLEELELIVDNLVE